MMNNEIMIYQMNTQHAKMAMTCLSNDILGAEAQPVIALIQEPYVGVGVDVLLRGKGRKGSGYF